MTKKVKFIKFKVDKEIDLSKYNFPIEKEVWEKSRKLSIVKDNNLCFGNIVSFKTEKTYTKYNNNKIEIGKNDGVNINFFILNTISKNGIWTTYQNATTLNCLEKLFEIRNSNETINYKISAICDNNDLTRFKNLLSITFYKES